MRRFIPILIFFALATACAFGQVATQEIDSVSMTLRKELLQNAGSAEMKQAELPASSSELPDVQPMNMEQPEIDLHLDLIPKGSRLPSWNSGRITGYHGSEANMYIGGIYYAGASLEQSLNRYWSVSAGVDLAKYSVLYNQASFNASVRYQPSKYFGITVFGMYSPGSFMSQMQIGKSFYYGGYISLETESNWGIDLGAVQSYYGMSNTHSITPIVRPYYNLNGAKIGLDFGPVIQSIMQKGKRSELDFNPTGPRPMRSLPPVGPRR